MAKVVAVIQARMGSSRLPRKVLMKVGPTTVLDEVVRRSKSIPGVSDVCCALPDLPQDDELAHAAERAGCILHRGSQDDVLARFAGAAKQTGADVVVRITGDKPLIDPEICGAVVKLIGENGAEFACNNIPPGWPHGLDCEVFTAKLLYRADAEAADPLDREHVTPWMRRHEEVKRASLVGPGGSCTELRWTLDFPEDHEFLDAVFKLLPPPPAMPLFNDVMAVLERHPEIVAINAGHGHLPRIARPDASAQSINYAAPGAR